MMDLGSSSSSWLRVISILLFVFLVSTTTLVAGWPLPLPLPSPLSKIWNFLPDLNNKLLGNSSIIQNSARVLNFFPIPVSDECLADDGRRSGACLNPYECRIQGGVSKGKCALGFGVCCVFTVSCGVEVINNVTYFVSPNFPGLTMDMGECIIQIRKISPEISQLRLDFDHFQLGQPNRRTGVCDTDMFVIGGGNYQEIKICGANSGQHVYYDIDDINEPVELTIRAAQPNIFRLWEIRISQIEFKRRAPAGCFQYFREPSGIIQTMNFAINGRHLADQDYTICMRQESGMCSISYEPCDENSFKIGPPISMTGDPGSGDGDVQISSAMSQIRGCQDRVMMPCDSEEFITPGGGPGVCDLLHCGNSFCTGSDLPCKIESSTLPFNIHVQFGPGLTEESPEDNLGMCLKYDQQPCIA